MSFAEYFSQVMKNSIRRMKSVVGRQERARAIMVKPWVIVRMKRWAAKARSKTASGDRTLNFEDRKSFSLSQGVKNIEQWLTTDDKRTSAQLQCVLDAVLAMDAKVSQLVAAPSLPPLALHPTTSMPLPPPSTVTQKDKE